VPKVFKQFGEDRDTIVVSPSGRGTSTWYVGRGHVDFRQVWADVFDTFAIDDDHVYVTGHSMGGWGSYLLTLLYPDRFAAGAPVAGPVTQGAWTGADFPGCDSMKYDDYTPCYIDANESRPRDQHTRKLLENSRHVPYAILQGTSDELVPYSGVFRQHERLVQLGYRHRLFTYPGYEHYTHPVTDQWAEAAAYLHRFTRPENPSRVTYKRDMPFERATEEVQSGGARLNFDFDSAYWMSGLKPVDMTVGVASFDGRSLGIPEDPYVAAPDTDAPTAPGQTGPYIVTGLQWLDDPTKSTPAAANAFTANLTGTAAVRLDLLRMAIDPGTSIAGAITTDHELSLGLDADWTTTPNVAVDGQPVAVQLADGVATVSVPSGTHNLLITPGAVTPEEIVTTVSFTERSDDSAQYSDTATLEARLTDSAGAPLAGEQLGFSLGASSAMGTTDADGVASVTVSINDAPGAYDAIVSYGGREGDLTPAVGSAPFTITKEDSVTTLTVSGNGSKRTLTALLTDSDAPTPVAGQTIVFTANGTQIGTATTDGSGRASISAPPGYRGGDITFAAAFGGNDFYSASSDNERV
jgi:pimeloyl-ACP methyl ester carboxylesterase